MANKPYIFTTHSLERLKRDNRITVDRIHKTWILPDRTLKSPSGNIERRKKFDTFILRVLSTPPGMYPVPKIVTVILSTDINRYPVKKMVSQNR
jgi:hypothetical protein